MITSLNSGNITGYEDECEEKGGGEGDTTAASAGRSTKEPAPGGIERGSGNGGGAGSCLSSSRPSP